MNANARITTTKMSRKTKWVMNLVDRSPQINVLLYSSNGLIFCALISKIKKIVELTKLDYLSPGIRVSVPASVLCNSEIRLI